MDEVRLSPLLTSELETVIGKELTNEVISRSYGDVQQKKKEWKGMGVPPVYEARVLYESFSKHLIEHMVNTKNEYKTN